ncbi:hypothetical protein [Hahella sp. CCB-MM4]|uniref:hypothetical protein n=1 Tax=Hahella sp. (strain CCB-MM4) TaxID=1926491 RepID=UPI00113FD3C4|nr:hypothetical protein [Hahella sp. CCB-MM4]
MNKILITLIVLLSLVGCTTYPSKMKLNVLSVDVIDYESINYFQVDYDGQGLTDVAAPTLKLHIQSEAFPYLYKNDKPFNFLCRLKRELVELSDIEFGRVYYTDPLVGLKEAPYAFEAKPDFREFYVYLFRSLKADSEVNRIGDIDLLDTDFSSIECSLVSPVFLLGFPVASKPIYIPRSQFLQAYRKYQKAPKAKGVIQLSEYERKLSNK